MVDSRKLFFVVALAAGCAGMDELPADDAQLDATRPAAAFDIEPMSAARPVDEAQLDAARSAGSVDIEAAPKRPSPSAKVELPAAAEAPSAVLAPAHAAPVPVVKAPPRKQEEQIAAVAPVAVSLDVPALKARLRETAAIGVLAKMSLSKQVDDLLESFRAHYAGGQKTSLAALRKPYDDLVMKVLDLLDERDPSLARSIASSREAIWEILADRERFSSMH